MIIIVDIISKVFDFLQKNIKCLIRLYDFMLQAKINLEKVNYDIKSSKNCQTSVACYIVFSYKQTLNIQRSVYKHIVYRIHYVCIYVCTLSNRLKTTYSFLYFLFINYYFMFTVMAEHIILCYVFLTYKYYSLKVEYTI